MQDTTRILSKHKLAVAVIVLVQCAASFTFAKVFIHNYRVLSVKLYEHILTR